MKIAILGWGSLVWDTRNLPAKGNWRNDGPILPLEFCRISQDGRLTMIINKTHGTENTVNYIESKDASLEKAINSLAKREKISKKYITSIGWINKKERIYNGDSEIVENIIEWLDKTDFNGVVWTNLSMRFKDAIDIEFNELSALGYLCSLKGKTRTRAFQYFNNAPQQIVTPVRDLFNDNFVKAI